MSKLLTWKMEFLIKITRHKFNIKDGLEFVYKMIFLWILYKIIKKGITYYTKFKEIKLAYTK